MPIHDWNRVSANVYHDFHNAWITHLKEALNGGILPDGYYAISDQRISATEPDVIATTTHADPTDVGDGAVAVAEPRIRLTQEAVPARRRRRHRRIVIQLEGDQRIVAVIEITSPANKDRTASVQTLAEKIASYLDEGVHALLVDILPPTSRDPRGVASAVWEYFGRRRYTPTADEPLTLGAFRVTEDGVEAQLEPTAVGRTLVPMPLYLTSDLAVAAPLEESYMMAFRGIAKPAREILERPAAPTTA